MREERDVKNELPLYFLKKRLGGKEEERINSLPLSISQEKDRTRKKREVVFQNYRVTDAYRLYGSYNIKIHTGYTVHIVKLEVQYMTLDVCIDLLASYFKLGKVGAAHRAVGYLGFILDGGRKPLDASPAKRVVAIGDNNIGGCKIIKAERTFTFGSIFGNGKVLD